MDFGKNLLQKYGWKEGELTECNANLLLVTNSSSIIQLFPIFFSSIVLPAIVADITVRM